MATFTMESDGFIDHITSLFNTREKFQDMLEAAQGDVPSLAAMRRDDMPGETRLDLSPYLVDGIGGELIGDEIPVDDYKSYRNIYPLTEFYTSVRASRANVKTTEARNITLSRLVTQFPSNVAKLAQAELVSLLNLGRTVTPSNIDDAPVAQLLFDDEHRFGGPLGPIWDNNLVANPLTPVALTDVILGYFRALVSHWETAPDTNGIERGFNNNLGNLLIICSSNIGYLIRQIHDSIQVPVAAGGFVINEFANNFDYIILPELNDSYTIATRKPTATVPGFIWGVGDLETRAGIPDDRYNSYRWVTIADMVVCATTCQASVILAA